MSESFLAQASRIIGSEGVKKGKEDTWPFEVAPSKFRGESIAAVMPKTTEEVQALIRLASTNGIRLIPQGANTGLVGAQVPREAEKDVVLSLLNLRQMPEINPLDRTARVSAGLRLSQINEVAANHGLWFPVSIGSDPTIGGLISTNAGGASLIRHGEVRSSVLGLEVVCATADAPILDMLNNVRKDNSGFDLKQLFIGTGGSLGVITQAVVSLQTLPRNFCMCVLGIDAEYFDLSNFVSALESSFQNELTSLEGISAAALKRGQVGGADTGFPSELENSNDFQILLEFGTSLPGVELTNVVQDWLLDWTDTHGDFKSSFFLDRQRAWAFRHRLALATAEKSEMIAFDVCVPRSAVMRCRTKMASIVRRHLPTAEVFDYGHIGDGGLHFFVIGELEFAAVARVRREVYTCVVGEFKGSAFAEHGVGPYNVMARNRLRSGSASLLIRAIKELLDPQGMLGHSSP